MPQDKRTYEVTMRLVNPQPSQTIEVEAHTPGLALKYAENQHPGYAAIEINGVKVIGRCCRCEVFILAGDRSTTSRGRLICEDCG